MTTPPASRELFAIRDDSTGLYYYRVPNEMVRTASYREGFALFGGEQPMERLGDRSEWWACSAPVTTLTASWTPEPMTVSYRLLDPAMESQAFPATLTPQQRTDLVRQYPDATRDLYEAVTEAQPRRTEALPGGPWRILAGDAPPAGGDPRWVADLPQALVNHPEYRWWLPGKVTGLRDAVNTFARRLPQVDTLLTSSTRYGDLRDGLLKVVVEVPFERPVTRTRTHDRLTDKKLRRPVTETVTARFNLNLPVPDAVAGDTYTQALESWQEQYAFWTGLIAQQAGVSACNTCSGHGWVPDSQPEHTPLPSPRRDH